MLLQLGIITAILTGVYYLLAAIIEDMGNRIEDKDSSKFEIMYNIAYFLCYLIVINFAATCVILPFGIIVEIIKLLW